MVCPGCRESRDQGLFFPRLSHQPKLCNALRINFFLVTKTHRPKCQDGFARFVHRFDLIFKPRRGRHRAQLAGSSNYEHRSAPTGRRSVDAIDKGVGDISANTDRVALASNTNHLGADIDAIGTRCLIVAGTKAQGRVLIAGVVAKERPITTGGVVVAGGVETKRSSADGCVSNAGGVARIAA